jgi:3-oxoacyl-[acyl-carrier protein] reductase
MRERHWGRIVAVGSSGMVAPLANLAPSNLGRAALAGYLKTLATEVAPDGVTVNIAVPGSIATDRIASLNNATASARGLTAEQVGEEAQARIPARRYGRPDEFGAMAAFLCGEPAAYITGTMFRCDGGLTPVL